MSQTLWVKYCESLTVDKQTVDSQNKVNTQENTHYYQQVCIMQFIMSESQNCREKFCN